MEMNCESCGMPMKKPEDHGAGNETLKYCKYCAPDGNLRSREVIREGWISALMNMEDITRKEAEKKVDEVMPQMPAWKEK
ncbi:MAG: zinc ribbon domain-containing protein [Elusimicrobia bacterium]|nr:zinc ribbon domain-containing protein [Elusimicrobiota bacterium]